MAHCRHMGVNAVAVAERGCKSERQAAAIPSDTSRQMFGAAPPTVYTERGAWPAAAQI